MQLFLQRAGHFQVATGGILWLAAGELKAKVVAELKKKSKLIGGCEKI
jgi:hypothetical protein